MLCARMSLPFLLQLPMVCRSAMALYPTPNQGRCAIRQIPASVALSRVFADSASCCVESRAKRVPAANTNATAVTRIAAEVNMISLDNASCRRRMKTIMSNGTVSIVATQTPREKVNAISRPEPSIVNVTKRLLTVRVTPMSHSTT